MVYLVRSKSTTTYIAITAYCRECKQHDFKNTYKIRVQEPPAEGVLQSIVTVSCSQHHHDSESPESTRSSSPAALSLSPTRSVSSVTSSQPRPVSPTPHITGKDRSEIAIRILSEAGGSAKRFRMNEIADLNKNVASEDVYRKILSEYLHREDVSHDW